MCGLGRVAESPGKLAFRGFARFAVALASRAPMTLPTLCIPVAWGLHTPAVGFYLKHFAHGLGDLDSRTLMDPVVRGALVAAFRESARGGYRGPCHDLCLAAQPWGFDPRDIAVPVHLFHGDRDRVVPYSMSIDLARLIRGARLDILPGEGHYSLPVTHCREALERLRAHEPESPRRNENEEARNRAAEKDF
jgi:pimeloyl-ACP methyl ester carboxylesterase